MTNAWRSLLFVPANDERKIRGASKRGADAIILDLEDAVPPEAKDGARLFLREAISIIAGDGVPIVVRINSRWFEAIADLQACIVQGVNAIMVPKVDNPSRVAILGEIIEDFSGRLDINPPGIIALIESSTGVMRAGDIASTASVAGLAFGPEDYALQTGTSPTPYALELPFGLLCLAASSNCIKMYGLPASIAEPADNNSWQDGIAKATALGGDGALCIHPSQVEAANKGFTPTVDQISYAKRVVDAWEKGEVILLDGRMIDLPIFRRAQAIIAKAELLS